jgi:hypothetical protein
VIRFFSHRSDHIPIIFRTVKQRELAHGSSNKKKFKLEAMWVKSDECEEVIRPAIGLRC